MIVIVATEDDAAVQLVVDALARRGCHEVLWVDLEEAFDKLILESRVDRTGVKWSIRSKAQPALTAGPDNVTAVYWRRPVKYLGSPFMGIPTSANLDRVEIFWSVRWHLESLSSALFPLGHPWIFARAENKHRQMEAAQRVGFRVPETLHSNDPELLASFAESHPHLAVKALRMPAVSTSGHVSQARHISCKSFEGGALAKRLRGMAQSQPYCQPAVARRKDWRITVLPHRTICAEIDISLLEGNQLDWRGHSFRLPHRIVEVEPAFESQLRHYLKEMELTAGYFDFAAADEGPPVFFECNTNAQWHWLEMMTGFPIADAIAGELLGSATL